MKITLVKHYCLFLFVLLLGCLTVQASNVRRIRAKSNPNLWGTITNIKRSQSGTGIIPNGLYSFIPGPDVTFQPLGSKNSPTAVIGGKMYSFYTDDSNPFDVHYYYKITDIDTWKVEKTEELQNSKLVPLEVAQDGINNIVYGQFNDNGLQIAKLDVAGKTKTVIGSSPRRYIAMGVTSTGKLYGIGTDAKLYEISTSDASETLIGSTGINLRVEGYQSFMTYSQSGEIDQTSDTFYWDAVNGKGESCLYKVNLTDASLEKIADLGDNAVQSMIAPLDLAPDKAPGSISNMDFDFKGSSLSGTIGFNLPSTAYDGTQLEGEVGWKLYANDSLLSQGEGNTGERVLQQVTLHDGESTIKLETSNAAGSSYPYTVYHWTGYDIPLPVANLQLRFDQDKGVANLSWDAVKSALHGGYITSPTYNVYRISKAGTELIAGDLSSPEFTDTLPTGGVLKAISYGVETVNGEKKGETVKTKSFIWGQPNTTPWSEDFSSEESFSLWTIEDSNGDNMTWSCIPYFKAAYSGGSNDVDCDDWLFTPPIRLEQGKMYSLKYTATNEYASYNFIQKMEVKLGKGANAEAMSKTIVSERNIDDSTSPKEVLFNISETGTYNIGFHDVSPADMYQISLSNVSIDELGGNNAPDSVTNLIITPGAQGEHSATISFNAPKVSMSGAELSSISKIEITRDYNLIKTFENPTPGELLEYTDNAELSDNNYIYTVIAYNDKGAGEKSTKTVYVGLDRPSSVSNISYSDNTSSVDVTWAPASTVGARGGYVNPDNVVYYVYQVNRDNVVEKELGHTSSNEFKIDTRTDEGEQKQSRWSVIARNNIGSDPNCLFADNSVAVANVKLITGKPYDLPYEESFANQTFVHYCWRENSSYRFYTAFAKGMSSDADSVSLAFVVSELGDSTDGHFTTGKINLTNAVQPYFEFDYYYVPDHDMKLVVSVLDEQLQLHELGSIDYNESGEEGWKTAKFEIPSSLIGSKYIMCRIHAYINNLQSPMLIDNIRIYNKNSNGINSVWQERNDKTTIYNLQGMRLNVESIKDLQPGVYIINGKKILIK